MASVKFKLSWTFSRRCIYIPSAFGLFVAVLLTKASAINEGCLRLNGACVESCPPELVVANRECVQNCPDGFRVADDNVTCLNCSAAGRNETCQRDCPTGTYPDPANETGGCLQCSPLCAVCAGPEAHQCQKCTSVMFNGKCVLDCPGPYSMLYNGQCLSDCPNSTYWIRGQHHCFDHCPDTHRFTFESECKSSCDQFIHQNNCLAFCPNGTFRVENICWDACPETRPYHFGGECFRSCPRAYRYSLQGECVSTCPAAMKFVPGKRECVDRCPRHIPLSFNQVCMRTCPPGTYRILEESGFYCYPYVGLRGIAAVIASLLVLVCVVFGICMSKQYNVVRKTEESMASMVHESEKAMIKDDSGRYGRSATIGLIHVHSDRRTSAEQPLLPSGGM